MDTPEKRKKEQERIEKCKSEVPVEQMRPDDSEESILIPPTTQEVNAAVEGLNPDENSMNSRG